MQKGQPAFTYSNAMTLLPWRMIAGQLYACHRLGLDAEVVKAVALRQLRRDREASGEGNLPQGGSSSPSTGSDASAAASAAAAARRELAAAAAAGAKAAGQRRGNKAVKGEGRALAQFCRDLCAEALSGRLDPVSNSKL